MQLFKTKNKTSAAGSESGNLPAKKKCHVIVTGNEKGGSGKTTTTMHLIVALLRLGFKVGTIDIDSRQRTLSRYIENRKATTRKRNVKLPQPENLVIQKSPFNLVNEAEDDERNRFMAGMNQLMQQNDFVIVDSPGNDTFMSRLAHSYADIVITPINDSFVDLDVLATVDGSTLKIIRPSIYSEMVWEQKLQRAKRDGGSIDWIVMRNRLSNIDARNKRFMNKVLDELSRRIGFRVAPGFSERVIYRELFLQGLTVLDVMDVTEGVNVSMSHVAARQEVRDLLKMLQLSKVDERINELRAKASKKKINPVATAKKAENKTASSGNDNQTKVTAEADAETDKKADVVKAEKAEKKDQVSKLSDSISKQAESSKAASAASKDDKTPQEKAAKASTGSEKAERSLEAAN
jgi:chromosome partitioning protein